MKNKIKRDSLDNKNIVVQSNSLIERSCTLTVYEQKIIFAVMSMISPEDKDFCSYTFRISEFMKIAGIEDQTAYTRIRDLSKGLMQKVIQIKRPKSTLYVNWFSSVEYFDGEGYVEIQVSPKLKPYLLSLKEQFTQYQLKQVMKLKSFYSMRIYELLKQYEKLQERTFELEILRKVLGISPETYLLYGHFKKKVLLVAQQELAEKTDLMFEYEEIKKRKKVEKIKFYILKNEKTPNYCTEIVVQKSKKNEISEVLMSAIPNKEKISSVFNLIIQYLKDNFSEDYILSNIKYTGKHAKKNFLIYLKKALLNDYAKDERELAIKEREIEEKQKKLSEEAERITREREKLDQEKKQREDDQLFTIISQLPEHHYKEIEQQAAVRLKKFPPPLNANSDVLSRWQRNYMVDVYKMLNKSGKL